MHYFLFKHLNPFSKIGSIHTVCPSPVIVTRWSRSTKIHWINGYIYCSIGMVSGYVVPWLSRQGFESPAESLSSLSLNLSVFRNTDHYNAKASYKSTLIIPFLSPASPINTRNHSVSGISFIQIKNMTGAGTDPWVKLFPDVLPLIKSSHLSSHHLALHPFHLVSAYPSNSFQSPKKCFIIIILVKVASLCIHAPLV